MKFIRSLKCDLNKTVINKGFVGAILLTTLLSFTAGVYMDTETQKSYSVYEAIFSFDKTFIQGEYSFAAIIIFQKALSGFITMFLPIIAAFPFMVSFCAERNSGYIRYEIARTGKLRYYLSKFLASFLSGGTAVLLGIALFGLLVWALFPSIASYELAEDMLMLVLPNSVGVSVLKFLCTAFLYGAISTLPAFLISSISRNPYLITSVPFMLIYIWNTLINKLIDRALEAGNFDSFEKITWFSPDSIALLNYQQSSNGVMGILLFNGACLLLSLCGFVFFMSKRIDKGY